MKLKFIIVLLTQVVIIRISLAQNFIKMGDRAPELKVKWLKGDPINSFEKGHVYMVEFWATWCKPCIANIPHLSELSRKYKDKNVSIIGVNLNIADNLSADSLLNFIHKMGNKMDYLVAMDGKDNFMQEQWMKKGVSNGVPTSFIVDQKGNIAWAGHPAIADSILNEIVKGTNSYEAVEKALKRQPKPKWDQPWNDKIAEKSTKFRFMLYKGQYKKVIKEYHQVFSEDPETALGLNNKKFNALLHLDFHKALSYYKELIQKEDPSCLTISIYDVAEKDGLPEIFYKVAKDFIEKRMKNYKREHVDYLTTCCYGLAGVYSHIGNEKKALNLLNFYMATFALNGGIIDPRFIEDQERRLRMYERKYQSAFLPNTQINQLTRLNIEEQKNEPAFLSKRGLKPMTKLEILKEKLNSSLIFGTVNESIRLMDSIRNLNPAFEFYTSYKFRLLLGSDRQSAYKVLEEDLNTDSLHIHAGDLSMCSALYANVANSKLDNQGIVLANRLCKRGLTTKNPAEALYFYQLQIQLALKEKDYQKAVQIQHQVINCLNKIKYDEQALSITMDFLQKYQQKKLDEYKNGLINGQKGVDHAS